MARPRKSRRLAGVPAPVIYFPAGWTEGHCAPVEVAIEDFEIMRLVDGRGYLLEEAAQLVGVSRSTAGRMLERVRRVVAQGIELRAPFSIDAGEDLVLQPPRVENAWLQTRHLSGSAEGLAVACDDVTPDAPVEKLFGRTPAFVFVGRDATILGRVENPGFGVHRNAAKQAVGLLKAQGVSRVVAGRFGTEALHLLARHGIQAVVAAGLSLGQAIHYLQPGGKNE